MRRTLMTEIHDVALTGGDHEFRVRVYPASDPNGSVLVWAHGGAFMFGDLDMPEADQVGRRLSAAGTTVVSVDYTLAPLDALRELPPPPPGAEIPSPDQIAASADAERPRARFPVASLQLVAAFDWAVANAERFGTDRVSIGGASAGGNLASGAAMRLRDRGETLPHAVALVYPVAHAPLPPADAALEALLTQIPEFLTFPPSATTAINRNYLGDAVDDRGYAFPGGRDLTGYPPTLIVNADRDRLRASGEAFAAELALAGVDVSVARMPGALHGFLNEVGDAAAERTLALLARAVV